jgi:opacity protein-like surface antigen
MRKILTAAILVAGLQGAQAADMPALRGGYSDMGPARPMWDGFYIGGQAAQGWAQIKPSPGYNGSLVTTYQQTTGLTGYPFPTLASGNGDKAAYGGFAGYNSQWEDVVVGIEASYLHSSLAGNSNNTLNTYAAGGVLTSTTQSNLSVAIKDFGSVRLRGGYMMGSFLPYAFVGVGAGSVDIRQSAGVTFASNVVTPLPAFATITQPDRIVYGYSAGVGLDVSLIGGLFARLEYEYMRLTSKVETNLNTVRVGLGYKF